MVFKWRINRPAFQSAVGGVDVMHAGIETEFETGSIAEAHGIFTDSGTALAEMFGDTLMASASGLALAVGGDTGGEAAPNEAQGEQTATRRGRGKAKDKSQPDPSTTVAPPPVTIPGTEAPPTAPVADDGIPPFLDRNAAAAPPAPPPPPAAPVAPAAPPTGVLAGKVVAELERRAAGAPDGGQALADWLATFGLTVKGSTLPEAIVVVRLTPDDKLVQVADLLKVA